MRRLFRIKAGDIAVVAAVLFAAIALAFCAHPDKTAASFTVKNCLTGESVTRASADFGEYIITSGDYTLVYIIDENGVAVVSSNCPNHYCVKSGHIRKDGEAIICSPARVVITANGGEGSGNDAVAG